MRRILSGLASIILVCWTTTAFGGDVVGWRFDGTGRYPNARPPTEWAGPASRPDDTVDRPGQPYSTAVVAARPPRPAGPVQLPGVQNVVWATSMPDWSNASPIIVGDRLFVQAELTELLCIDARNGKILWTRSNNLTDALTPAERDQAAKDALLAEAARRRIKAIGESSKELRDMLRRLVAVTSGPDTAPDADTASMISRLKGQLATSDTLAAEEKALLAQLTRWEDPETNLVNGYSSPTPTSDGTFVYCVFGNGVIACYDLGGNRKWIRHVGRSGADDGASSSPVLADGKLLVHLGSLQALDPATGEIKWAAKQTPEAYGTPAVGAIDGIRVAVTANGDVVRLRDGAVMARKVSLCAFASPLLDNNIAYFVQNIGKAWGGGHAVKLTKSGDDALAPTVLWQTKTAKDRMYASAVLLDGLIYAVNQTNTLSVLNAATGEIINETKLELGPGVCFPSLCLAGGLLFVSSANGTTAIIKPGRVPEVVRINRLEPFRSTPLFVGERIYIRGLTHLYCVGATPQ